VLSFVVVVVVVVVAVVEAMEGKMLVGMQIYNCDFRCKNQKSGLVRLEPDRPRS